jgi:hypothetical protein
VHVSSTSAQPASAGTCDALLSLAECTRAVHPFAAHSCGNERTTSTHR